MESAAVTARYLDKLKAEQKKMQAEVERLRRETSARAKAQPPTVKAAAAPADVAPAKPAVVAAVAASAVAPHPDPAIAGAFVINMGIAGAAKQAQPATAPPVAGPAVAPAVQPAAAPAPAAPAVAPGPMGMVAGVVPANAPVVGAPAQEPWAPWPHAFVHGVPVALGPGVPVPYPPPPPVPAPAPAPAPIAPAIPAAFVARFDGDAVRGHCPTRREMSKALQTGTTYAAIAQTYFFLIVLVVWNVYSLYFPQYTPQWLEAHLHPIVLNSLHLMHPIGTFVWSFMSISAAFPTLLCFVFAMTFSCLCAHRVKIRHFISYAADNGARDERLIDSRYKNIDNRPIELVEVTISTTNFFKFMVGLLLANWTAFGVACLGGPVVAPSTIAVCMAVNHVVCYVIQLFTVAPWVDRWTLRRFYATRLHLTCPAAWLGVVLARLPAGSSEHLIRSRIDALGQMNVEAQNVARYMAGVLKLAQLLLPALERSFTVDRAPSVGRLVEVTF